MKNRFIYTLLLIIMCIISAFSQVILKKASLNTYPRFLGQYLNPLVICGYSLFFLVVSVNIYILRFLPMTIMMTVSESLSPLLSFVTGHIFFREQITKGKLIGGFFIIIGIIVISL